MRGMSTMTVEKVGRVTVGRADYGWGVEADQVKIAGEYVVIVGGRYWTACGRCPDWSGSLREFGHVLSGVCFECNGRGTRKVYDSPEQIVRLVKRRESDRKRAARKEAERLAAQDAERDAWAAANPEVVAALAEVLADLPEWDRESDPHADVHYEASRDAEEKWGDFLTSLAVQSVHRPLSEKQAAAVVPAVEKAKARHAAKVEKAQASRYWGAEGDKVVGTGVVTVRATYDASYGYRSATGVLLVVAGSGDFEGVTFKAAGTGATLWDAAKGDEVEVRGAVKDHSEYEGVKQTVLTRAKVKVTKEAAVEG